MAGTPITPWDLTTVTTVAATDHVLIFRDGAEEDISVLNFLTKAREITDANLSTVRFATLDATQKLNTAQLPTGFDSGAPLGNWSKDNDDPVLTDGTGTAGDKYAVYDSGTVSQGAGTLSLLNGITVDQGDIVFYTGTVWDWVPNVANQLDGSTDEDSAATLGDYYRKGDVNDRTLSAQPANSVILGTNGYLAPGAAYPGTTPLRDKFTALLTVRFHSFPASGDAQVAMISASGLASSATNGGIQIETDGTIDVNHYDGGFNQLLDILGGSVELGKTYCIAYRVDSANDGLTVFIDGVKGSSVATGVGTVTTGRWILGCNDENNEGTEVINFRPFNRVLSDAEVAFYSKYQGVKASDQWGGADGAFYSETTWSGASGTTQPSGWSKNGSPTGMTSATHDGQTTAFGMTAASSGTGVYDIVFTLGKRYRVSFKAKVISGEIALECGDPTNPIGGNLTTANAGSWTTFTVDILATSTALTWYANTSSTEAWLDDLEITEIGVVAPLLPENILPTGNINDPANGLRYLGTNVTPVNRPTAGQFTEEIELAHGSISSSAATTTLLTLPKGCRVVSIETIVDTAFDSSTTLDIGISGTGDKYANNIDVASIARRFNSNANASESDTASTAIYVQKNQATTLGNAKFRVTYEITAPTV